MKNYKALFIVIALSSCSSIDQNNIAPGYFQAYNAVKTAIVGYENTNITREVVNNIPYASSLIRIGKGPYGLMILDRKVNSFETWVTADQVYLVIQNGRIVKTAGLENNLTEVLLPLGYSFKEIFLNKGKQELKFYYSYRNPDLYGLPLTATYKVFGREEIVILGKKQELIRIEERIQNQEIGWDISNTYWLDNNFDVWKSYQSISPKLPKFQIEVTKKPS